MRIHALDIGGSSYVFKQRMFCAIQRYGKPGDLFVTYDFVVGKISKWEDAMAAGHDAIRSNPCNKASCKSIFDWMESRFISSHDILILYSDFIETPDLPEEDTFFRTEFVTCGLWPGQRFFNHNVYRVGEYEEGYGVVPWPDHPALVG